MHDRIATYLEGNFGIGSLVPDNYLMYAVAFVLGTYLTVREAERKELDQAVVFRSSLVIVLAAAVCARLFVVAQYWGYYRVHQADIVKVWEGGMASTGAYLGGIAASFIVARWHRLPLARFLDASALSVALSIFICRIGCFLNGCCYGSISDLPWAVCFPPDTGPYQNHLAQGLISAGQNSLPIHPVQLYEAMYGLVIFGVLSAYKRKQKRDGELIALLFFLYPAGRFFNEFLRAGDRSAIGFLSIPQVMALVLMAASCVFFFFSNMTQQLSAKNNLLPVNKERQV